MRRAARLFSIEEFARELSLSLPFARAGQGGSAWLFFPERLLFLPSFLPPESQPRNGPRRESEPSEMKKKGEKKGKGRVWRGVSGKNEKCRWFPSERMDHDVASMEIFRGLVGGSREVDAPGR